MYTQILVAAVGISGAMAAPAKRQVCNPARSSCDPAVLATQVLPSQATAWQASTTAPAASSAAASICNPARSSCDPAVLATQVLPSQATAWQASTTAPAAASSAAASICNPARSSCDPAVLATQVLPSQATAWQSTAAASPTAAAPTGAAGKTWSLHNFSIYCGDSSCDYNFGLDKHDGAIKNCTIIPDGKTPTTSWGGEPCDSGEGGDAYTVGWGYSDATTPAFGVLTVVDTSNGLRAFFGVPNVTSSNDQVWGPIGPETVFKSDNTTPA